jgi:hypothetical protein
MPSGEMRFRYFGRPCRPGRLAIPLSLLVLAGCAGQPSIPASCGSGSIAVTAPVDPVNEQRVGLSCRQTVTENRPTAAIGSVQRTNSQTRTVGVPPGFLVAMIILILLVSLA